MHPLLLGNGSVRCVSKVELNVLEISLVLLQPVMS